MTQFVGTYEKGTPMTTTEQTMNFTKVDRGWYATDDGTYAVVVDGYEPSKHVGERWTARGRYEGFQGGEWACVYDPAGRTRTDHNAGENVDWFPTRREAVACANRHARSRH